ncbi:hypothetical protein Csa_008209 [Cucumis sativus]|nr:hypothetical protein Csa_008209 [Cucumis sativus]
MSRRTRFLAAEMHHCSVVQIPGVRCPLHYMTSFEGYSMYERPWGHLCFSGQQMQMQMQNLGSAFVTSGPLYLPTINLLRHRKTREKASVPFFNHSPSKDGMSF